MMTPPWTFGCTTRTELFLRTLKHMEDSGDLERAYNSSDMRYTYAIFRRHEGFGDFLAYQFALDFSYNHLMFDYEKFIVPEYGFRLITELFQHISYQIPYVSSF